MGNHPFEVTPKRGTPRVYCSDEHQHQAAAQRQVERYGKLAERRCAKCKKVRPAADFAGPRAVYCHTCMAAYERGRRAANPDPLRSRRDSLARYGLTFEQFDAMLAAQDGRCAVCRTGKPGGTGRDGPRGWHVHHDHSCCNTRKRSCGKCVLFIACGNCNIGIGNLKDDPAILRKAADLIEDYRARRDAEGHINPVKEIGAAVST